MLKKLLLLCTAGLMAILPILPTSAYSAPNSYSRRGDMRPGYYRHNYQRPRYDRRRRQPDNRYRQNNRRDNQRRPSNQNRPR
ncbi:MAG: hypothetical protein ABF461_04930 [Zymomonas mobilis subsp. pomaceae]|uniref:hypothetical protein n=1 Tax=Zymomonas mobilis TaxID=542 RepID=UPI00130DCF10|nr:hypothetical protein [Zymomonas mobilis]MDX5947993.1 hypothetical protein [Zymomonas mobilis subsp. pomaceae]